MTVYTIKEGVTMINSRKNKVNALRIEINRLVVKDIESWVEQRHSLMAYLRYESGQLTFRNSKNPSSLKYYEEAKTHLRNYGAYDLWKQAMNSWQKLKDEGISLFNQFKSQVDNIINDLPFEKTASQTPETYCIPKRVYFAVFHETEEVIKDKKFQGSFHIEKLSENRYLLKWETEILAKGDRKNIEYLKKRLDNLKTISEIQETTKSFRKVESRFCENEFLDRFEKKVLLEVIKPFRVNIPLKGKCKNCEHVTFFHISPTSF